MLTGRMSFVQRANLLDNGIRRRRRDATSSWSLVAVKKVPQKKKQQNKEIV